jgi:hypothetical protein
MFVELGDTLYVVKGNHSPTTGGLADPSAATAKWHEDGAAGSATGVTVTSPFDTTTGQIKVEVVCSSGNGFELGKRYSLMLYTTTGGVDSATEIANFQIVAASLIAGYPLGDVGAVSGDTAAADTLESHLDSDTDPWDGGGGGDAPNYLLGPARVDVDASTLVFFKVPAAVTPQTGLYFRGFWIAPDGTVTAFAVPGLVGAVEFAQVDATDTPGVYSFDPTGVSEDPGGVVLWLQAATYSEGYIDVGDPFTVGFRVGAPTALEASITALPAAIGARAVEGSHTHDDLIRLIVGILAGTVADFETDTQAYRSLNGVKTRYTVTTDDSGRVSIIIGDLT